MMLVLGGNSVLGRMVISKLQTILNKDQLIISVRDLKKAQDLMDCGYEVRHADFDDITTLKSAFSGINKLFVTAQVPRSSTSRDLFAGSRINHH